MFVFGRIISAPTVICLTMLVYPSRLNSYKTSRQKILLGCAAMALAMTGDYLLGFGTFSMINSMLLK